MQAWAAQLLSGHSLQRSVGSQSITVVQRCLESQVSSQAPWMQSTLTQAPFVQVPQSGGGGGQSVHVSHLPRHAGRSYVHEPSALHVKGSSVTGQSGPLQGLQGSPQGRPAQGSIPGHIGVLERQLPPTHSAEGQASSPFGQGEHGRSTTGQSVEVRQAGPLPPTLEPPVGAEPPGPLPPFEPPVPLVPPGELPPPDVPPPPLGSPASPPSPAVSSPPSNERPLQATTTAKKKPATVGRITARTPSRTRSAGTRRPRTSCPGTRDILSSSGNPMRSCTPAPDLAGRPIRKLRSRSPSSRNFHLGTCNKDPSVGSPSPSCTRPCSSAPRRRTCRRRCTRRPRRRRGNPCPCRGYTVRHTRDRHTDRCRRIRASRSSNDH